MYNFQSALSCLLAIGITQLLLIIYRYPGGFVLYGGKLRTGSFSNELWLYDVSRAKWSRRAQDSKFQPPGLAKHSLTLGPDYSLYVVGGSKQHGYFSSAVYRIKLSSGIVLGASCLRSLQVTTLITLF